MLERLEAENATLRARIALLGPTLRGLTGHAVEAQRELARLRRDNRALATRLTEYERVPQPLGAASFADAA